MSTVTDTFDRVDNPLTLGNAETGQTWVPSFGSTWGIITDNAYSPVIGSVVPPQGVISSAAVIDASMHNVIAQVTVADYGTNGGPRLVFWYVDDSNYLVLLFREDFNIWTYYEIINSIQTDVHFFNLEQDPPVNGDVMKVVLCDDPIPTIRLYQNETLLFAQNQTNPAPFTSATFYGIGADNNTCRLNDFSVIINSECFSGSADWTLPTLQWTAEITVTEPPPLPAVNTVRFDEGLGSSYYIIPPVVDSGNELRSKVVKSMRSTGRRTNVSMTAYGYDVNDEIVVADLEAGTNASTRAQDLPDTTQVAQSPRKQINVKNAVLHTVRLEGDDTGQEERDEVHEIVVEQADEGVRR